MKQEAKKTHENFEDNSAFAELLKEIEKEKKKLKIVYIIGSLVLVLATISILLFGPFNIPVFSQLGNNILGKSNYAKEESIDENINDEEKSPIEETAEKEEVVEETIAEEKVTTPKAKTTTPKVSCAQSDIDFYKENYCYWVAEGEQDLSYWENGLASCGISYSKNNCPKNYICSDEQIGSLQSEIATKEDQKSRAEKLVNDRFFICFDELTSTVPGQTDIWYQQECAKVICQQLYPDLCTLPDDFQTEINALQSELNTCLSDR